MTKKSCVYMAIIVSAVLSVLFFFYLPIEVAGHRPGNFFLLAFYIGFLSITTAFVIVFLMLVATRRTFIKQQITTFKRFRHLLLLMVKRDFVTRYRRNMLGVLWSMLNPLATMLVMAMVFSLLFQHEIPNFPVYLFSGQLIFNFFSESTTSAMSSIVGSAGIIKKVYVPKYIFPVSRILSSLINLGFSFAAFLLIFIATGESFGWTFLFIPLLLLYVLVFSMGVGMFLSSVSVFFRDINYIYGIGITLLMFLTPLFYPVSILPPRVYHLIHLNPLFHFVTYFRELVLYGNVPGLWLNIICIGFALGALSLGAYTSATKQDKYILYL